LGQDSPERPAFSLVSKGIEFLEFWTLRHAILQFMLPIDRFFCLAVDPTTRTEKVRLEVENPR
jgi:hypothetical protein